jgi:hypothetical protein
VTRIGQDDTMRRRRVDIAQRADGPQWEDLAARALARLLLLLLLYTPVRGPPSTTSASMTV